MGVYAPFSIEYPFFLHGNFSYLINPLDLIKSRFRRKIEEPFKVIERLFENSLSILISYGLAVTMNINGISIPSQVRPGPAAAAVCTVKVPVVNGVALMNE